MGFTQFDCLYPSLPAFFVPSLVDDNSSSPMIPQPGESRRSHQWSFKPSASTAFSHATVFLPASSRYVGVQCGDKLVTWFETDVHIKRPPAVKVGGVAVAWLTSAAPLSCPPACFHMSSRHDHEAMMPRHSAKEHPFAFGILVPPSLQEHNTPSPLMPGGLAWLSSCPIQFLEHMVHDRPPCRCHPLTLGQRA